MLTASRMYSPHNSHEFLQQVQTPFPPKVKTFFQNSFCILEIKKKDHLHSLNISEVIDSEIMWLLECLKAPVSEQPSGINVFTARKHFQNLPVCMFTLLFH